MRKWTLPLLLALALSACTTRTPYGECIGAFDDKDPQLHYSVSKKNIVLALFFVQSFWVPVNVVGWNTYCPDRKSEP